MDHASDTKLQLTGETVNATYHLRATPLEAEAVARDLCTEQTVEFPLDLIERDDILEGIVAKVVRLTQIGDDESVSVSSNGSSHEVSFAVEIAFPVEVIGGELTQLLNALFGNISLKPGIRLVDVELPHTLRRSFPGPSRGRRGLREALGVSERPLLATALKPMGLSPRELADLAAQFAEGGIDIIKDDHGLTDQVFCPFEERVKRCADRVRAASSRQGRPCLYFANITGPADQVLHRAVIAQEAGAGGLMVAPGLVGLDTMARLAATKEVDLPIMSHPAFQGAFTLSDRAGIAHGVLYGLFNRLAGADISVFPHARGRFTFSDQDCRDIVEWTERDLGHIASSFPAPAGGMTLDRVGEMVRFYGPEVVLLIGGDLHRHGRTLVDGCRRFLELAQDSVKA